MSCGIHTYTCPRKCHDHRDHRDLVCAVRVKTELPCGHSVNRRCHQSNTPPDACVTCKLAQRKAEGEAGASDPSSESADSRPQTPPTWRLPTTTTRGEGTWRNGRSTGRVFATYRGSRQISDTYRGGLFSRPILQAETIASLRGSYFGRGYTGRGRGYTSRGRGGRGSWRGRFVLGGEPGAL